MSMWTVQRADEEDNRPTSQVSKDESTLKRRWYLMPKFNEVETAPPKIDTSTWELHTDGQGHDGSNPTSSNAADTVNYDAKSNSCDAMMNPGPAASSSENTSNSCGTIMNSDATSSSSRATMMNSDAMVTSTDTLVNFDAALNSCDISSKSNATLNSCDTNNEF